MSGEAMTTAAPPEPAADRAGRIETHGADYIPPADRHGHPRELFWAWISANVIYLYFVIGGVLMLLGLTLWEALAITIVGNLWWAAVGWLAIVGPVLAGVLYAILWLTCAPYHDRAARPAPAEAPAAGAIYEEVPA